MRGATNELNEQDRHFHIARVRELRLAENGRAVLGEHGSEPLATHQPRTVQPIAQTKPLLLLS